MAQLQTTSITGSFNLKLTTSSSIARSMWFDSTSGYMKLYIDAWAAGGAMSDARQNLGGVGTQNEALAFGGFISPLAVSCTEEYNGLSWTVGSTLITARFGLTGAGTQNAGLAFGGRTPTYVSCTEEYNGTSWTGGGSMITAVQRSGGAGTQNEALAFGGATPTTIVSCTEEYNGSTWAAGGALINVRYILAGVGTQNEALAFGGISGSSGLSSLTYTEEYDGSTWAAGGALINARYGLGGVGTQNEALAFGGENEIGAVSCTEKYNGSTWSESSGLITARGNFSDTGAGTQNTALAFGGGLGSPTFAAVSCTEKYIGEVYLLNSTITPPPATTTTTSTTTSTTTAAPTTTSTTTTTTTAATPTGSIDTSFNIGTGFGDRATGVLVDSNQKIIAAGLFSDYSGSATYQIVRINSNGTKDTSFNTGLNGFNSGDVFTITFDSSERILAGGAFSLYSGSTSNGLVRINSDGTKDTSFNVGDGFNGAPLTSLVQSDGKILVGGGFTSYSGSAQNRLIRLNSDGIKDTSFNVGDGFNGQVNSVAIQSDGKVLAGGLFTTYTGSTQNYLIRLNSDGTKDTSFDVGTGFNAGVYAITIQSDGKILAGGSFTSYSGSAQNRLIRINSDGTKDTSFDVGTGFANNTVFEIVVDSNGKILVGGGFASYNGSTQNGLIRLNSDGTKDTSFDVGTGFDFGCESIAIQSDGKTIVVGSFTSYSGSVQNRIVRII